MRRGYVLPEPASNRRVARISSILTLRWFARRSATIIKNSSVICRADAVMAIPLTTRSCQLRIPLKWGTDSGDVGQRRSEATLVTDMISEVPHLSQGFSG